MPLSPEELLAPRYKVIADYPGCPWDVGTILIPDKDGELYSETGGYSWSVIKIMEDEAKNFTHLVEPLPWYSDRKIEDMPEYLKRPVDQKPMNKEVNKVKEYKVSENGLIAYHDTGSYQHIDWFIPATLEEYTNYINQIKK